MVCPGYPLSAIRCQLSSDRQPAVLEDLSRDDEPVDFARAFVNFGDPGVAEVPLDRVLLRVTVSPVNLERPGRDPLRHLRREELRDRGLHRVTAAVQPRGVLRRGGPTGQETPGL